MPAPTVSKAWSVVFLIQTNYNSLSILFFTRRKRTACYCKSARCVCGRGALACACLCGSQKSMSVSSFIVSHFISETDSFTESVTQPLVRLSRQQLPPGAAFLCPSPALKLQAYGAGPSFIVAAKDLRPLPRPTDALHFKSTLRPLYKELRKSPKQTAILGLKTSMPAFSSTPSRT